jgi:hypothetical protein
MTYSRQQWRHPERHGILGACATYGVAETSEAVPEAQQLTHDLVIEQAGALRRSGVSWLIYKRDEIPPQLIDSIRSVPMYDADQQPVEDSWAGYQERLDAWPDSYFVVAMVRAIVPEGVEAIR